MKKNKPQPAESLDGLDGIVRDAVEALAKLPPDEHGKCDCEFCTRQRQSIIRTAIAQATEPLRDDLRLIAAHTEHSDCSVPNPLEICVCCVAEYALTRLNEKGASDESS